MLFELSTNEIQALQNDFKHAYQALLYMVQEHCPEKADKLRFPAIKYEPDDRGSWIEFYRCFHKDRKKHFAQLLVPKYKNGDTFMRAI